MKFKSEPNLHIIDSKTHKLLGKFDENGYFKTENEQLINRLKYKFKIVKEHKQNKGKQEGD